MQKNNYMIGPCARPQAGGWALRHKTFMTGLAPAGRGGGAFAHMGGAAEHLPAGPFVLLDDARSGGSAKVFAAPVRTICARSEAEVPDALEAVRRGLREGLHAAGWLSYEAGRMLEPRLQRHPQRAAAHAAPVLWFGLFESVEHVSTDQVVKRLPSGAGAWISVARPRITEAQYARAFQRAHDYIVAGDIYQVNLSYRADVTVLGDPRAVYARLRAAGAGGWSALVHDGRDWLVSTSPELFFKLSADGRIEARPMKGTAPRRDDPEEDKRAAIALQRDPKERAENVMIVDLLRNDISKLASRGSVHVPELFAVETYPTLHTLTSTVRAQIRPEHDSIDAIKALFPCGSITGAPKVRAMEVIRELEPDERGPYTGAIGWFAPDGAAEFSVAIRTLVLSQGRAELGVGSAVVYDSSVAKEWEECRTKSAFLTRGAPEFELIETMRFEPERGVFQFDRHLARLSAAAATFAFGYDEEKIRALVAGATQLGAACVLRIALAPDGAVALSTAPIRRFSPAPLVGVAPLPVDASDYRLRFKTSNRSFYDDARCASGCEEVIFVDPDGFVTEGSITNVFVARGDALITPPARRGLLPGILRQSLLDAGEAREGDLRLEDLSDGFLIGNAVRGLVSVRLATASIAEQRAS